MGKAEKKKRKIMKEQLGMDYGRASAKLKKMILFDLAKKVAGGKVKCIRCRKEIKEIKDFTVDHIKPWLHNSSDLFWDLNNIAFSHFTCNASDRRNATNIDRSHLRKSGPPGTNWCHICQDFVSIKLFWKDASKWSGYQNKCIKCSKKRNRKKLK